MRWLRAWRERRQLVTATGVDTTVPFTIFEPWPGPVYYRLPSGANLATLAFCKSCGTIVHPDNPDNPITCRAHDEWHRRVVTV